MIDIVIYYPYLDGTTTSLVDLWYNLKGRMDVNCNIVVDNNMKRNLDYFVTLRKSMPSDFHFNIITMEHLCCKKFDTVIVSFGIFRFLDKICFDYDKMIVLDSGRIVYDYYVNDKKFINYVKSLDNVVVFGNRMNFEFFDKWDKYNIYYHKFSHERFNHLKQLNQTDLVLNEDKRELTGNLKFECLSAKELNYNRWRDVCGDGKIYSENIGKMIFEFSAMDKKVHYSPKNKTRNDGLTEYLSLFNIDDSIEQDIHISEQMLFDKLGFSDKDMLFAEVKR